MTAVARAFPRLWDGRLWDGRLWDGRSLLHVLTSRLLQFLTGMALIALAFAVPSLAGPPEVPAPPAIVTVVDAPSASDSPTAEDAVCDDQPTDATPATSVSEEVNSFNAALPGSNQPGTHSGRAPPA